MFSCTRVRHGRMDYCFKNNLCLGHAPEALWNAAPRRRFSIGQSGGKPPQSKALRATPSFFMRQWVRPGAHEELFRK